jgi:myo-inositol-1(or 4)-monophosphatase
VAAGAMIVKNAGGIVTDFNREENYIFGKQIIATNPAIHQEFMELFAGWKKE